MAKYATGKTRRPAARKAVGKPTKNAVRRKKRTAQRKQRAVAQQAVRRSRGLPGWSDLAKGNERVASRPPAGALIEKISTVRFGLLLFCIAASITLYVGHVQATQEMLEEVQQARRDNLRLHLKLDRLKGDFDRATGPAVIYRRARALGLEEGIAYGPAIKVAHSD